MLNHFTVAELRQLVLNLEAYRARLDYSNTSPDSWEYQGIARALQEIRKLLT